MTEASKPDPFEAIKLKREEEKLKVLQAETEAKIKRIATETKLFDDEAAERAKQFALETKAKDVAIQKLVAEATEQINKARLVAQQVWRRRLRYGLWIGASLFLAADYMYHDYKPWIHRRMKATILDYHRNQKMQRTPPVYCPSHPSQTPLLPKGIPVLFLGPSGSGKSTILAKILREYLESMLSLNPTPPPTKFYSSIRAFLGLAPSPSLLKTPSPVVLISLRDARTEKSKEEADYKQQLQKPNEAAMKTNEELALQKAAEESALFRMNKVAAQVFDQIGFPSRKPLISYVKDVPRIFGFLSDAKAQYELEVQTKTRFEYALKCLFDVCVDIRNDRYNSGLYSENEASVILLLDEVHDLVKESKLRSIGGERIFGYLAELLVSHGVNVGHIRSVIAGSSGQLRTDVEKTAIGKRYSTYYLHDPEVETVKVKLRDKGYTEEDCSKIINVCGTRLRLLQEPLEDRVNVDAFIVGLRDAMIGTYKDFFEQIRSSSEKKQMVKTFDSIYKNEVVDWTTEVPTAVTTLDSDYFTKLLYMDTKKEVRFQSQVARDVWPIVRTQKFVR